MKDHESLAEQAYEVQRAYVRNEPGLPDMPSWEQVGWAVKGPYREAARGQSDCSAIPPMARASLLQAGVSPELPGSAGDEKAPAKTAKKKTTKLKK